MKLIAIILVILLAFPVPVLAQTPREQLDQAPEMEFVEKPTTTKCAEGQKCFDVENFKLYLQMRVQYKWLFTAHTSIWPAIESELKKSLEAEKKAGALHEQDAKRWQKAYEELFPKYTGAVQRAHEAEATSIWGGGLPWLITAAVAGIALGTVAGIWIESKVNP